jgi:hypothetical protein
MKARLLRESFFCGEYGALKVWITLRQKALSGDKGKEPADQELRTAAKGSLTSSARSTAGIG